VLRSDSFASVTRTGPQEWTRKPNVQVARCTRRRELTTASGDVAASYANSKAQAPASQALVSDEDGRKELEAIFAAYESEQMSWSVSPGRAGVAV
jgi:hypothetical protein